MTAEGPRKARPEIKKFFIQQEFSQIVAEFGAVVAYDMPHRFVNDLRCAGIRGDARYSSIELAKPSWELKIGRLTATPNLGFESKLATGWSCLRCEVSDVGCLGAGSVCRSGRFSTVRMERLGSVRSRQGRVVCSIRDLSNASSGSHHPDAL